MHLLFVKLTDMVELAGNQGLKFLPSLRSAVCDKQQAT
jgi:hypothetical protein